MKDRCYCWCSREFAPASGVKCPGCNELYCSQSCVNDAADWHVRRCTNPLRPLTTADSLVTAVFADMFPDDLQTLEDYFFTRARTTGDKTNLLGLYIGVVKILHTKPSTLHEWRVSGTLAENIKELYKTIPSGNRGGYHAWFLQNLNLFIPLSNALVPLASKHTCASCSLPAVKQCSKCKNVWYCSKECQVKDWGGHRAKCDPNRDLTPADKLKAAVHHRKVPTDPEVIADYGFDRVDEIGQKILLEVYRVVFEGGTHPREVERWKDSGTLLQEIEKLMFRLPTWKTADTMKWFVAHRYAFDPTMPAPALGQSDAARLLPAAILELWSKVGDSRFPCHDASEVYATMDRLGWSQSRRAFFMFRVLLGLEQCHPSPDLPSWLDFGFCACYDEQEESFLALTYQLLSNRCSYDEFFSAFDSSALIALLDAKELRGRRMALPYLEDVLSGSPRMFKSVWNLKQYVFGSAVSLATLQLSVHVDYGFSNCKSESEHDDLKDMYKKIFEHKDVNPLKLHEACISGMLYDFTVGMFPELKKKKNRSMKFKRLMKNPYPLPVFDEELNDELDDALADPHPLADPCPMPGAWPP